MGRETSILVTMKDQASAAFSTLTNSNKQFKQAMEDSMRTAEAYQKRQDALTKQLASATTAQTVAKQAVADATKAWKEQRDEVSKINMDKAQEEYKQTTADMKNLQQAVNSTGKDLANLDAQQRRMENSGIGGGSGSGGMMEQMAKAGFTKMAGDLAATAANTLVSSAFGTEAGGVFQSALSSAATGAAMGSIVPGLGTAAGAAIGGLIGAATGGLQVLENRDNAFKGEVQGLVESTLAGQTASLGTGSGIAARREQNQIAFANRLGSDEDAAAFLEDVRLMAIKTNYDYDEITGYAKSMLNFAGTDEVLSLLGTLSDTTAGLGLDRSDVGMMIQGLQQMRIAPERDAIQRTTNYFANRGVDVYQAVGDHLGVDKSTALGMLADHDVSNEDVYQALVKFMDNTFGGLSEELAGSYTGMLDNLGDLQADLDAAMGRGYNEARKEGIGEQMAFMEGESGDRMQEAYGRMGEFQAFLENEAERYEREMLDAVMTGAIPAGYSDTVNDKLAQLAADYAAAMESGGTESGALAGQALANAKALALMEYNASDGARIALDSELALAASIRDDMATNAAYYDAGIIKGREYSKGLAAAISGTNSGLAAGGLSVVSYDSFGAVPGFAYGLNRVPYDGFPAVLHEGERVLTASEARNAGSGGGSGVSVHIGEVKVYGADEAAAYQVAQILAAEVSAAAANLA